MVTVSREIYGINRKPIHGYVCLYRSPQQLQCPGNGRVPRFNVNFKVNFGLLIALYEIKLALHINTTGGTRRGNSLLNSWWKRPVPQLWALTTALFNFIFRPLFLKTSLRTNPRFFNKNNSNSRSFFPNPVRCQSIK